jgi:hypothetical protein
VTCTCPAYKLQLPCFASDCRVTSFTATALGQLTRDRVLDLQDWSTPPVSISASDMQRTSSHYGCVAIISSHLTEGCQSPLHCRSIQPSFLQPDSRHSCRLATIMQRFNKCTVGRVEVSYWTNKGSRGSDWLPFSIVPRWVGWARWRSVGR